MGLKMAQYTPPPSSPSSLGFLSSLAERDAKGLGRGLISNCNAANRPSAATSYYRAAPSLAPPAWLACASQRPWGPGIRLESRFQECHLPLLMVLIIGTGWRAGSGGAEADSLLRLSPQCCSTEEAGQSWHLAGAGEAAESSMLFGLPCRCLLHLRALPESWRMGSDGVRGYQIPGVQWWWGGGGKGVGRRGRSQGGGWEVPAPHFATLYHDKSLPVWDPKPSVTDQKGRSLLSYLRSEQNSTESRNSHPLPRETWQSLLSVGTSPAGSLSRGSS